MFFPKKTKYRKCFKGRIKGEAKGGYSLDFGEYGLKALEAARVKSKQIEAARKVITRTLKRTGQVWIRAFAHTPVSKKPADVRMGKGKGAVEFWICKVKPGRMMFEIGGVSEELAKLALTKAALKLSGKYKFTSNLSASE